eukprot:CAMPEP_0117584220 /NCGR_PEP_ID=MMETSP0784-20121206/67472_1 /TAXON_ID=39447 /ORGANISM="" /LENGTH=91 /DNA_ID=CAMNT_0005385039 /DNA_START=279 /DNA_END=554 /DNA_ORIENTATION=-
MEEVEDQAVVRVTRCAFVRGHFLDELVDLFHLGQPLHDESRKQHRDIWLMAVIIACLVPTSRDRTSDKRQTGPMADAAKLRRELLKRLGAE